MPVLAFSFQLLFMLLSLPLYLCLGRVLLVLLAKILGALGKGSGGPPSFGSSETAALPLFVQFMLGLLFQCYVSFLFRSLQFSWILSLLLSFTPLFLITRAEVQELLRKSRPRFSLNFVLWSCVVCLLGVSLMGVSDEISTPWVNNYGDLAFHLGMISSFVFGGNFPPEYHIYPGQVLSYPVLINYWTASYWQFYPVYSILPFIFFFQWVVLWTVVYFALNGERWKLLPWAALLGGGSYELFYRVVSAQPGSEFFEAHAHSFLDKGYPWAPFLSTIWVTQRPAMFGLAALLSALWVYHRSIKGSSASESEGGVGASIAGSILALSILAHVHFMVAGCLYIASDILFRFICKIGTGHQCEIELRRLIHFVLPLVFCLFAFPWLLGKAGIISLTAGWMPWPKPESGELLLSVWRSLLMWFRNAPLWFVLLAAVSSIGGVRRQGLVLVFLFILGNSVQLAVWDWDQIKFFLALYLTTLSIISFLDKEKSAYLSVLLLLLLVPAAYECYRVIVHYQDYVVYSKTDLAMAEGIRLICPEDAVIAAKPDHNSAVTLSGRRLYAGYDGTLSSHGIDYGARFSLLKDLKRIANCREEEDSVLKPCPSYLLWSDREKQLYQKQQPEPAESCELLSGNFLYQVEAR
jgi:hypothetical protein